MQIGQIIGKAINWQPVQNYIGRLEARAAVKKNKATIIPPKEMYQLILTGLISAPVISVLSLVFLLSTAVSTTLTEISLVATAIICGLVPGLKAALSFGERFDQATKERKARVRESLLIQKALGTAPSKEEQQDDVGLSEKCLQARQAKRIIMKHVLATAYEQHLALLERYLPTLPDKGASWGQLVTELKQRKTLLVNGGDVAQAEEYRKTLEFNEAVSRVEVIALIEDSFAQLATEHEFLRESIGRLSALGQQLQDAQAKDEVEFYRGLLAIRLELIEKEKYDLQTLIRNVADLPGEQIGPETIIAIDFQGMGAMGGVLQAVHIGRAARRVAIKFIAEQGTSPDFEAYYARFTREGEVGAALNHRHINKVHQVEHQENKGQIRRLLTQVLEAPVGYISLAQFQEVVFKAAGRADEQLVQDAWEAMQTAGFLTMPTKGSVIAMITSVNEQAFAAGEQAFQAQYLEKFGSDVLSDIFDLFYKSQKLTSAAKQTIQKVQEAKESIPYLVQDFIEGVALDALIERLGPFPLSYIKPVFSQLLDALEYCGENGIVHRDVKPSNIMFALELLRAMLIDFGIVRKTDQRQGSELTEMVKLTQERSTMGTPSYMAPEHLKCQDVTTRADLCALGLTLFDAVTGETLMPTQELRFSYLGIDSQAGFDTLLNRQLSAGLSYPYEGKVYLEELQTLLGDKVDSLIPLLKQKGVLAEPDSEGGMRVLRTEFDAIIAAEISEKIRTPLLSLLAKAHNRLFYLISGMTQIDPEARLSFTEARLELARL